MNSQIAPAIAALAGGGFVIGWDGYGSAEGQGAYVRRYNGVGTAQGAEILANTTTTNTQADVEPPVASGPLSATREAGSSALPKGGPRTKSVAAVDARCSSEQGFLSISLDAYLKLLDWTGRQVRAAGSGSSQRGVIPSDLQPILDRRRIVGDAQVDSVRHFGRWFHCAVGSAANMQSAAARAGKRWFPPPLLPAGGF